MKSKIQTSLCLCLAWILFAGLVPARLSAQSGNPDFDLAKSVATSLTAKQYHDVANHFDPTLAANLNEKQVEQAWEQMTANAGNFKLLGNPRATIIQGNNIVEIVAAFDNGSLVVRIMPDGNGMLAGLWVAPNGMAGGAASAKNGLGDAAKAVAQELIDQKTADVRAKFDDYMNQNLTDAMMDKAWATTLQTSGPVSSIDSVQSAPSPQGGIAEQVKCIAANCNVYVVVVYDSAGKIGGLWVRPGQ